MDESGADAPVAVLGPVSGLASGKIPGRPAFPREITQWHDGGPSLAYRCGGSAGFGADGTGPASRFIPWGRPWDTVEPVLVSTLRQSVNRGSRHFAIRQRPINDQRRCDRGLHGQRCGKTGDRLAAQTLIRVADIFGQQAGRLWRQAMGDQGRH